MKNYISAFILITVLSACEDATNTIEQAQEAVDSIKDKIDSIDMDQLNLEQFGDATKSAKVLASSIEEALNVDFSDPHAIVEVKEHIANAYRCLIDVSSESSAEKFMNKVMASINNEEAESLIEKGIEKAKAVQKCVL